MKNQTPYNLAHKDHIQSNPDVIVTKLGKIPEDWGYSTLGKLVKESRLGGNYINNNTPSNYPLIKMGNIGRGAISLKNKYFIDENEALDPNDILEYGDFLFNTRNTLELVGKAAVWKDDLPLAYYNSNLLRIKFDTAFIGSSFFMNFIFNSSLGLRQLRRYAIGTTSVAAIYNRDLFKFKVPLPPLPEQRIIVEILSTWDEAIDKLTALIEKKKELKRGLMQQLLTGKRRFPEFVKSTEMKKTKLGWIPVDWDYVPINKIAQQASIINIEGRTLPVLSCTKHHGLVDSLKYFGKQIFSNDLSTYKVVKKWQFAYATNHLEEGSIGYQNLHDHALISPMYTAFETSAEIDDIFLFNLLKTDLFIHIYQTRTSASVNRRGSIRWGVFSTIKIPLPSMPEQHKIAETLSICNNEIEGFNRRLDKLKAMKKGLMQQLLTGKTRVNIN